MGGFVSKPFSDSIRPVAAVYGGPIACDGCAESVARLLRHSNPHFKVSYLGPNEENDVTAESLKKLDLFAWPGGGDDVDDEFPQIAHYAQPIRQYVSSGGLYLGICYGAFLARGPGPDRPYFNLLPPGNWVSSERFENGSQVKGAEDAIILTDWAFHTGKKRGTVEKRRWQYFQDGGQVHLDKSVLRDTIIMGNYTYTGDPDAIIQRLDKGAIGLIGTHPEADESWYEDWDGHNPDGIRHDIGNDFVQTLWDTRMNLD
ncbi:hypothetical protein BD324DRAFT_625628 [Kockovaella imperatae]|uniref:Biotin-protein ligase N-terminal domain-containing protein n=1 Tax=Kockovaella imperatae TaxID=4999 RepID=A0A1Y1UGY2_9TREE|nr:hypothetical protein BD324DRAFT_625628 [Kockovaella imperatae]ORX37298.1 hypothetical protein BD324DRAFT_625628 [Kockovaella imperatae]